MAVFTIAFAMLLAQSAYGFAPMRFGTSTTTTTTSAREVRLHAKKARSKPNKKSGPSSGGGFGASATKKKSHNPVDDDYTVFPKLEPDVLKTLVPATLDAPPVGDEVYERLDQIYGLPQFNYNSLEKESELSFTDLLSSGSTSSSSSSSSLTGLLGGDSSSSTTTTASSLGSSELDDLLKSATGGSASSSISSQSTTPETPAAPTLLTLDQLPAFPHVRALHMDPLVLSVDNFFTEEECDRYIAISSKKKKEVMESRSPTVGKDAAAKSQRTSTTWYHHYRNVPELMAKASRLLGLDTIDRWEEPQTVRYRRNEKFTWHLDALGPAENQPQMGGQRTATLLVYLTDLSKEEGGATLFRDLGGEEGLRVQPKKGSALLFFPAAGGIPNAPYDIRTLHCGEVVAEDSSADKWISQLWLRERAYAPTAPPGNTHGKATDAIEEYCASHGS